MRRTLLKNYEIWEEKGKDPYGQANPPTYTGKDVECTLALTSQDIVSDNVKYHLQFYAGLTWSKDLQVGQILVNGEDKYKITGVNNYSRKTQLTLDKL